MTATVPLAILATVPATDSAPEKNAADAARPGRPLCIAALIKQVPVADSLEDISLGPDGRLQRGGLPADMNPYCRRAVSQGVELARASGGTCTVFTLGPPAAEDVLREAVAWGADTGVHLCDPAFAGSDTLATSRALAAALAREGPFDLVLTGRNTTDGDTGQVGPQLAQLLNLPFAEGVRDLALDGETLRLRLEQDDGWEEVSVTLPVLISAAERLIEPAKVDPAGRAAVPAEHIRLLTAADLGPGPWGEAGSPTRVGAVRVHHHNRTQQILKGDLDGQVADAVALLRKRGSLNDSPANISAPERKKVGGLAARDDATHTIAVVLEPDRVSVAAELIGEASRLAGEVGARVVAFRPERGTPGDLGALGADDVVEWEGVPAPEGVARDLVAWAGEAQPWLVLAPGTAFGREVAARTSAALGAGLVGDAIGLDVAGDRIVAAKPAFAGTLVADITCKSAVQLITVRPGVLRPVATSGRTARTGRRTLTPRHRITVLSRTRDDDVEVLARARTVIGVGMGVLPEEYGELEPLRIALGAELAATRRVTDKGWMPRARQVGLTGRSIAPRLYVALGLSGKFNHTVGVGQSGTILAVNTDPEALVFGHCDIGIVGDWHAVVPLLTAALKAIS